MHDNEVSRSFCSLIVCYMHLIVTIVIRNYYQQLVNVSTVICISQCISKTASNSGHRTADRADSKQGNKPEMTKSSSLAYVLSLLSVLCTV